MQKAVLALFLFGDTSLKQANAYSYDEEFAAFQTEFGFMVKNQGEACQQSYECGWSLQCIDGQCASKPYTDGNQQSGRKTLAKKASSTSKPVCAGTNKPCGGTCCQAKQWCSKGVCQACKKTGAPDSKCFGFADRCCSGVCRRNGPNLANAVCAAAECSADAVICGGKCCDLKTNKCVFSETPVNDEYPQLCLPKSEEISECTSTVQKGDACGDGACCADPLSCLDGICKAWLP